MIEIRHEGMDDTFATQQNYNQLYQSKGIRNQDSFYLWLIKLFEASPNKRMLDISCGEGQLVILARQMGIDAIGVDFALSALKVASAHDSQSWWIAGDGENLPLSSARYDYITHIGSLEHYQNPMEGIHENTRVLKPGRVACILLPNS